MSVPIDLILARLRGRGDVKPRGNGWRCACPAHDDVHPSLDVDVGREDRVLLCCRSRNCSAASIAGALGLGLRDLFNGSFAADRLSFDERVVATYDYRNKNGVLLFQTVRLTEPKDFRQRRPKGNGWEWKLGDTRRVLYRLPELLAADASATVFVVEGEKDADNLAKLGLVATTNPMGAGKWRKEYAESLRGRPVVILPDNDEQGRKHAKDVAGSLHCVAASVRVVALPDLPPKGDVSDWLAAGGTAERLATLVAKASTDEPASNCRDSGDGGRDESPANWGPPAPLPVMPPAVPFPLGSFPAKLADYWQAAAESLHVPVDYVAVPALPLLGAAIGRSRAASVKRTYSEPPLLWAVVVALPGRAKSPALRLAKGPLSAHTRKWREKHKDKVATFEAEFGKYEAAFAKWKKNPAGDTPKKPDRPTLKQLVIDKFTVESLVRINADNPRGVVLAQDELAALVNGLGQYKGGKGDDKQTMLSIWAGAEAEVNRVKDKEGGGLPLYIAHSFVGVSGMIQPDLLPLLRGDFSRPNAEFVNDGWADRFLLSYPEPQPLAGETWATVPEKLEQGYAEVFDLLLGLEMVAEVEVVGGTTLRPFYLPFDPAARDAWQEFTDGVAAQANALDQTDNYIGAMSKLRHYGLRLTTLTHCLRAACGELKDGSPVDGETVRRAAELVRYFEAHGRRCLGVGFADRPTRIANRILAWLTRNPDRTQFSRTETFLALKDRKDVKSSESLGVAFRLLTDFNYLQPLKHQENMRPGPVPETYLVNPVWDRVSVKPIPRVPTVERMTDKPLSNSRDSRDGFVEKRAATVPGDDPRSNPEADPEAFERWAIENEDNALFPNARDTPPD